MRAVLKAMYSPRSFDLLFGVLGIICMILLYQWSNIPIPAIEPSDEPGKRVAVLFGVFVGASLLATATTRLDQTWAEDYVFRILSKSALVGIMGTVFAFVIWNALLGGSLGRLSSMGTIAVLLVCWSISYFIVRIRGTGV